MLKNQILFEINANDETSRAFRSAKDGINKFRKDTVQATTALAKYTAAAALAGAAIGIHLVRNAMEAIDAQAKLAQQFGETSETMATLTRAGDLTGVALDKISAANKILAVNLGKATDEGSKQAQVLSRLGLEAKTLADLPLDQRILAINSAIQQNIPAVERAAVAAELFGAKNAQAMALLNPDAIARAARETEILGLALSDIDASKVEAANDAFATIGMGMSGLAQQMAVELSPIIQGIGDQFFKAAEEAGGMGQVADNAFSFMVDASVFVVNAIDGIGRSFVLTADLGIAAFSKFESWFYAFEASQRSLWQRITGIDMTSSIDHFTAKAKLADGVLQEAMANIANTLDRPLSGETFKRFVKDAQDAADEAARVAVDLRKHLMVGGGEEGEDDAELKAAEKRAQDLIALEIMLYETLTGIEEKHAAERQKRADQAQQLQAVATQAFLTNMNRQVDILQNAFHDSSALGKAFFLVQQSMSAANAIISGFDAAMKIRAAYAAYGPAGMAAGETYAKASIAMGFASAGAIMGQTLASFEGGGFTGYGPRSGGLDGRGGFAAIVHPNETIIDNSRGGGAVNVNINISTVDQRGVSEFFASNRPFIYREVRKALNDQGRAL